jgi:hypothetical protein
MAISALVGQPPDLMLGERPRYKGRVPVREPLAAQWAEGYAALFPPYQLLIESYSKAQEVVTKHEALDSQRK